MLSQATLKQDSQINYFVSNRVKAWRQNTSIKTFLECPSSAPAPSSPVALEGHLHWRFDSIVVESSSSLCIVEVLKSVPAWGMGGYVANELRP